MRPGTKVMSVASTSKKWGSHCCIVIALAALLACARRPVPVGVELPKGYLGEVTVELCVSGQPSVAHVDQRGQGKTSICVGKNERVGVFEVQGDTRTEIAQERVRIETTGDGFPRLVTFSQVR
jgi:hypothetical protein